MKAFNLEKKLSESPDPYIAHRIKDQDETQSISAHNQETASLAESFCAVQELAPAAYLAGRLHDAGKYSDGFQRYILQEDGAASQVRRGEVNHATAGGILMEELASKSSLSELIQIAVYSHHGLYDALDLSKGEPLIEKRQSKAYLDREKVEPERVKERFYQYVSRGELDVACQTAREGLKKLMGRIKSFAEQDQAQLYGSRDFYMGMHERLLLSLLIDADRGGTARFMSGAREDQGVAELPSKAWIRQVWTGCIEHFEDYLSGLEVNTDIGIYRRELSEICRIAAGCEQRLCRLTLPTGSGKTLCGLRFALHHAQKYDKQRIIYVAPFNSILEQNAREIRMALGRPELVLEHHCDVIPETEEEQERYDRLTENWMSPVIATTAVQLLEIFFSSRTGSVRRMHSLCDSIVIFDEIQAIPVQVVSLFNLAVNYLTAFCGTTVVLCSATQPVFDKLPRNRLLAPKEMVEDYERYDSAFRRVTLVDQTRIRQGGLSAEGLGEFVLDRLPAERQMLVVVNTKACAKHVYEYLKSRLGPECALYHLSTNMCALNRREVLKEVEGLLGGLSHVRPVVLVSTQLIEAGVNLSFRCVVRSLAGLDNVIQAAGRCNRHGERKSGNVYIVRMSDEAERLSNLPEIRSAQRAMEEVLRCYEMQPETVGGDLLSVQAKEQYYFRYLRDQIGKVDFPVNIHGEMTTLVELLSGNLPAQRQFFRNHGTPPKHLMKQAFRTAGDRFEVISDAGKVNVVVGYNSDIVSMLAELRTPYLLYGRQKEILRNLQLAAVGISEQMKNELGRAVTPVCDGLVYELDPAYYSKETGVSLEPVGMGFLNI